MPTSLVNLPAYSLIISHFVVSTEAVGLTVWVQPTSPKRPRKTTLRIRVIFELLSDLYQVNYPELIDSYS